ncbi:hypothetical protein RB653_007374 [Dictyostelium firmibasis]|uniref:Carbohydrate binding domain-containing protein n=1 Tax=Dictyostelium firmibasis TaxID=79012 RepID=A0AAN7TVI4_9MYCE
MKSIQLICAVLFCFAIASASHIRDCSIEPKQVSSWMENNHVVTQYSVTIYNHSNKVLKSINISTDSTLCLKDSTSIWNIERLSNGDLVLPVGQPTIAAKSSYTFYFILKGSALPNLHIKSVSY